MCQLDPDDSNKAHCCGLPVMCPDVGLHHRPSVTYLAVALLPGGLRIRAASCVVLAVFCLFLPDRPADFC